MSNNNAETREVVIKREDLSDKHRLYVEYLSGQLRDIFRDKGLASENDIKADTFTDEERKRIEKYQENIYHILTRGELPQEFQLENPLTPEFKREFSEFLKRFENIREDYRSFFAREKENDTIPMLSPEICLLDESVLERVITEIPRNYVYYPFTGNLVFVIYNESVKDLNNILGNEIVQKINLKLFPQEISGIAYEWRIGQLIVKGRAGLFFAEGLRGGRVLAESVGSNAGQYMSGGELEIKNYAGDFLGIRIQGGKITVKNAGKQVGLNRQGGEIHITNKCKSISEYKSDGKVFLRGKEVD